MTGFERRARNEGRPLEQLARQPIELVGFRKRM
jgi:hypothetical protein